MIDAKNIKPKQRGKSDFFSWHLYRWIKDLPYSCQIWRGTWNSATGIDRDRPVLYIGHMDDDTPGERWLHGRMLHNLCLHGQSIEGYAYGPGHDTEHWEEITEEWWAEYTKKGVCAIHGDLSHEWVEDGDTRTCKHCGKQEHRTTKLVEITVWL